MPSHYLVEFQYRVAGEKPFWQQPRPRLLLAAYIRQPLGTQLDAAPKVRLLLAAQSGQLEKPGVMQVAARSFFARSLGFARNRSSRNPACCQSRVRNCRKETRRASSCGRETVSAASVGLENARARCPGRLPEGTAGPWACARAFSRPEAFDRVQLQIWWRTFCRRCERQRM